MVVVVTVVVVVVPNETEEKKHHILDGNLSSCSAVDLRFRQHSPGVAVSVFCVCSVCVWEGGG